MLPPSSLSIQDRAAGIAVDLSTLVDRRVTELAHEASVRRGYASSEDSRYLLRVTGVPEVDDDAGEVAA